MVISFEWLLSYSLGKKEKKRGKKEKRDCTRRGGNAFSAAVLSVSVPVGAGLAGSAPSTSAGEARRAGSRLGFCFAVGSVHVLGAGMQLHVGAFPLLG